MTFLKFSFRFSYCVYRMLVLQLFVVVVSVVWCVFVVFWRTPSLSLRRGVQVQPDPSVLVEAVPR